MEEDDDVFLDAEGEGEVLQEYPHKAFRDLLRSDRGETVSEVSLGRGLYEGQLAIDMFFNNDFEAARTITYRYRDVSIYHALGYGTFNFLKAVMTFEQENVETASRVLTQSIDTIHNFRRKGGIAHSLGKMVKKKDYNEMTEIEVHAELVYGECILLKAMLTIVEDENLISFVKAGLKVRQAYISFKECWAILNNRDWNNDEQKHHFDGGVRLGVGTFHLLMSLLPTRITKLMEFVGFSGSKEIGMQELLSSYRNASCMRQFLASLILLAYHLFLTMNMGKPDDCDRKLVEEILSEKLAKYPNGAFFLFFKGRYEMICGRCESASQWYTRANNSQVSWPQFQHVGCWELLWSACFRLHWREALVHADRLLTESRWSPCMYSYIKAVLLSQLSQLTEEERTERQQLLEKVPQLKQRIAGKSVPMEKFAVKKAEKYLSQGRLVAPGLEMIYLWHGFSIIGQHFSMVESFHLAVEEIQSKLTDQTVEDDCLLDLLRGMSLKHMGFPLQAEDAFRSVLGRSNSILIDKYLVPYTTVELAILLLDQGDVAGSSALLTQVKCYTGYCLQSRLHFRIHAAQCRIKALQRKEGSDTSPGNSRRTSETLGELLVGEGELLEGGGEKEGGLEPTFSKYSLGPNNSTEAVNNGLVDHRDINPNI